MTLVDTMKNSKFRRKKAIICALYYFATIFKQILNKTIVKLWLTCQLHIQ